MQQSPNNGPNAVADSEPAIQTVRLPGSRHMVRQHVYKYDKPTIHGQLPRRASRPPTMRSDASWRGSRRPHVSTSHDRRTGVSGVPGGPGMLSARCCCWMADRWAACLRVELLLSRWWLCFVDPCPGLLPWRADSISSNIQLYVWICGNMAAERVNNMLRTMMEFDWHRWSHAAEVQNRLNGTKFLTIIH